VAIDIETENTIGGRLRAARVAAHLSLEAVADAAGLTSERLATIEEGAPVTTAELDRLASLVGSGVHGLLHGSDVGDVLGRVGDAGAADVDAAVALLAQFVRDYEFLCSLDE
jgi:transcriptional regulator with XRE-family HTH domain